MAGNEVLLFPQDVTKAIDEFHFNIAVAALRSLFNNISSHEIVTDEDASVVVYVTKNLLILINPMIPHLAEELWESLNNKDTISNEKWPQVDLNYIKKNNVKIPIQISGKVRAVIEVPIDTNKEEFKQRVVQLNAKESNTVDHLKLSSC